MDSRRTFFTTRRPDLVLILITLVWGSTFLTTQMGLQWAGPVTFVGLRFVVALVLLAAVSGASLRRLTRREWRAGLAIGVILFVGHTLQAAGLRFVSSSQSAFLTALYVPMVPLLQLVLLKKQPRLMAWAGIGLAFVGMLLLSSRQGVSLTSLTFGTGEWLTLISAVVIALEVVIISRFANDGDARNLGLIQIAVVVVLSLPTAVLAGEPMPRFTPGLIACVAGLGLATAFIQVGMTWAQKTVSATRATVIYAMEPVWAGLFGRAAGERLGSLGIAGAALIVTSVIISELRLSRRAERADRAGQAGDAGVMTDSALDEQAASVGKEGLMATTLKQACCRIGTASDASAAFTRVVPD